MSVPLLSRQLSSYSQKWLPISITEQYRDRMALRVSSGTGLWQ